MSTMDIQDARNGSADLRTRKKKKLINEYR